MVDEVVALTHHYWKQHYNTKHYTGSWSAIPLRSMFGNIEMDYALHSEGNSHIQYADTPLMQQCPYIQSVLQYFNCEMQSVRLMNLAAGAVIHEHTDHALDFESGEARFHIPILTNSEVSFMVQNEKIPLLPGECWYLNLSLPHSVRNDGTTDRVHLVIDCLVNDWLREQAAQPGVLLKEADAESLQPQYSPEEKTAIIAQLRSMGTETAVQLAQQMEKEI